MLSPSLTSVLVLVSDPWRALSPTRAEYKFLKVKIIREEIYTSSHGLALHTLTEVNLHSSEFSYEEVKYIHSASLY